MKEPGDGFRDTVTLTVRGDGLDIPPFFTLHTYKNASYSSGRRCARDETPVKGMTNARMLEYVDHVAEYVAEPSLLVMDRLSSHKSGQVIQHITSKRSADGEQLLYPILLPAKTAFLISPLDMGAIGAFKSHFYRLDRSTIDLKRRAMVQAWDAVSNETLRNICHNCGIVGEEPLQSLRSRFTREVVGIVPEKFEELLDFYDAWKSGLIEVEGATRGRGVTLEIPHQLPEAALDGQYWANFGCKRR